MAKICNVTPNLRDFCLRCPATKNDFREGIKLLIPSSRITLPDTRKTNLSGALLAVGKISLHTLNILCKEFLK
jgi:hypothetical protein